MSSFIVVADLLIDSATQRLTDEPLVVSYTHHNVSLPDFEMRPRDYLGFALTALGNTDVGSRINCILHLKKAIECQIDTYLHGWNMLKTLRRQKGLPAKLEMLKHLGVLDTRSVSRLNQMRNRVEHEFAKPDIADLDVYYDLTAIIITVLERSVATIDNVHVGTPKGYLEVTYRMTGPSIIFQFPRVGRLEEESDEADVLLEASLETERRLFARCFRTLTLLGDTTFQVIDDQTLVAQLKRIKEEDPLASASGSPLEDGSHRA